MDLNLRGKIALVAAASKGLGYATAYSLAQEGAQVIIFSRNHAEINDAAARIEAETGATVLPLVADAANPADLEAVFAQVTDRFGRLDALIVNAGGPPSGPFERFTDTDWEAAFQLTFLSAVRMVRHALPLLRAAGGGAVVGIQSTSIKQPVVDLVLSNSIRAGVAGLFKDLANTYGPEGIRFNLCSPGRIATDRVAQLDQGRAAAQGTTPEAIQAGWAKQLPLGRYGEPMEFGRAAAFLASPAASYITGQSLMVDGGLVKSL